MLFGITKDAVKKYRDCDQAYYDGLDLFKAFLHLEQSDIKIERLIIEVQKEEKLLQ